MNNCNVCGRILKNDSKYCDFCGTKIPENLNTEAEIQVLDIKLLLKWLLISIFITVLFAIITKNIGLPIFLGGLFLPFFFRKKKQK